ERLLLPGMFVREQIQEGVHQATVLAPQQAISRDQKGQPHGLVVGLNDVVELRTLQTGRAVGDQWIVTSGLRAGDRLIVEGLQFIQPGTKVVAEEYRSPSHKKPPNQAAVPTLPVMSAQPATE